MAKYILTKLQVKRLIDGKPVMDGRGRKLMASKNIKEVLEMLDKHNLYDKFDAVIENGQFDLVRKDVE